MYVARRGSGPCYADPVADDRELDGGIPLPGVVLPRDRWASTFLRDPGRPFDWPRCFGRAAPRVLDVGCGEGRYLIGSAVARPEVDHLGIDLLRPVVERAARRADRRGLSNVRFAAGDAVRWLFERLVPDSLDEIHVYHPQPYHDAEQVPLGMLMPAFLERAWIVLRRAGILVLQTDSKSYGGYLLEASRKHFDPKELSGPWPDAPLGRTRREILARRKGLRVRRIVASRREAPLAVVVPRPYFDAPRRRVRKRP